MVSENLIDYPIRITLLIIVINFKTLFNSTKKRSQNT